MSDKSTAQDLPEVKEVELAIKQAELKKLDAETNPRSAIFWIRLAVLSIIAPIVLATLALIPTWIATWLKVRDAEATVVALQEKEKELKRKIESLDKAARDSQSNYERAQVNYKAAAGQYVERDLEAQSLQLQIGSMKEKVTLLNEQIETENEKLAQAEDDLRKTRVANEDLLVKIEHEQKYRSSLKELAKRKFGLGGIGFKLGVDERNRLVHEFDAFNYDQLLFDDVDVEDGDRIGLMRDIAEFGSLVTTVRIDLGEKAAVSRDRLGRLVTHSDRLINNLRLLKGFSTIQVTLEVDDQVVQKADEEEHFDLAKHLTDEVIEVLSSLGQFNGLRLKTQDLRDETLLRLASINAPTKLELYSPKLTANGIGKLASFKSLQELIGFPFEPDLGGFEPLKDVTGLQVLRLPYNNNTSPAIQDSDLAFLKDLTALRDLDLVGRIQGDYIRQIDISNDGLAYLSGMKKLESLILGAAFDISDAGMVFLANLESLRLLDLRLANVSDVGLEQLQSLKQLDKLLLTGTRITDLGCKYLTAFKTLKELHLGSIEDEPHLQGPGLESIAQLSELELLDLTGNPLGDDAFKDLANLKNLRELILSKTSITDEGLRHFEKMTNLVWLDVSDTQVTRVGRDWLKS